MAECNAIKKEAGNMNLDMREMGDWKYFLYELKL